MYDIYVYNIYVYNNIYIYIYIFSPRARRGAAPQTRRARLAQQEEEEDDVIQKGTVVRMPSRRSGSCHSVAFVAFVACVMCVPWTNQDRESRSQHARSWRGSLASRASLGTRAFARVTNNGSVLAVTCALRGAMRRVQEWGLSGRAAPHRATASDPRHTIQNSECARVRARA